MLECVEYLEEGDAVFAAGEAEGDAGVVVEHVVAGDGVSDLLSDGGCEALGAEAFPAVGAVVDGGVAVASGAGLGHSVVSPLCRI